jgi:hypothetical protein
MWGDDVLSVPSVDVDDDVMSDDLDCWMCGDEETPVLARGETWERIFRSNRISYAKDATPATAALGLDVLLYDVLAETLVRRCGPRNRLGPSCVTVVLEVVPAGLQLAKYHELAKTMQIPVLLLWGPPPPPYSVRYATLLGGTPCNCHLSASQRGGDGAASGPGRQVLRPLNEAVWYYGEMFLSAHACT